jgi:hypothetical protein
MSTSTSTDAGSYSVTVTGKLYDPSNTVLKSETITIQVTIIEPCFNTVITTTDQDILYYNIRDPKTTATITPFTSSELGCGPFTYSINSDLSASVFSIDPNTGAVSVETYISTDHGTYTVTVTGTLYQPVSLEVFNSKSLTFSVIISEPCFNTVITTAPQSDFFYEVGSGLMEKALGEWSNTYGDACNYF